MSKKEEQIIKEVAQRIRLHADNIHIDFYGDEFASRLKNALQDLAHSIENPDRYNREEFEDQYDDEEEE